MKKVIPNLINYDQTTNIKGRFIGESIRLIDDILYYADQENLDGILFVADMEKAFDSVGHDLIFATLTKIYFGKVTYSGSELFSIVEAALSRTMAFNWVF